MESSSQAGQVYVGRDGDDKGSAPFIPSAGQHMVRRMVASNHVGKTAPPLEYLERDPVQDAGPELNAP